MVMDNYEELVVLIDQLFYQLDLGHLLYPIIWRREGDGIRSGSCAMLLGKQKLIFHIIYARRQPSDSGQNESSFVKLPILFTDQFKSALLTCVCE